MKLKSFIEFSTYGLKTIFLKNTNPILATIILTDYCNLTCKHCAVNNINKIIHPYEDIKEEMLKLYDEGVRILFFCGGETLLWKDKGKSAKDLIREAKEIGFELVNIVTNGTIDLDIKESDIIHAVEQIYTLQYIDKTWSIAQNNPCPEKIKLY